MKLDRATKSSVGYRRCVWTFFQKAALGLILIVLAGPLTGCTILRPDQGAPSYDLNLQIAADSKERQAEKATVRFRNLGCNALSTGSGVVIGARELLTNAHVIAGAEKVEITLWDGGTFMAKVVGATVAQDLAIVHVDVDLQKTQHLPVAQLDTVDPQAGAPLLVFGFPSGRGLTVLRGHLIHYVGEDEQRNFRMTNNVVPGNSGGPVFGTNGKVVGIVRAKLVETGEGLAIPATGVTKAVAEMRQGPVGSVPGCEAFSEQKRPQRPRSRGLGPF